MSPTPAAALDEKQQQKKKRARNVGSKVLSREFLSVFKTKGKGILVDYVASDMQRPRLIRDI